MGKLTSDQIKFIAQHYENIDKIYNSQIKFCFDNKNNGATAFKMLRDAYRSDIANYRYGTDYRDFRLEFTSRDVRNTIYNDIIDALSAYHSAFGYDTDHYQNIFSGDDNSGPDAATGPGNDQETKSTNWTTYLVIGAAAVAIILLLWNRKKK